jgi:hypothetical protein
MQAAPTDGRIIFARVVAMSAINEQQVRQPRYGIVMKEKSPFNFNDGIIMSLQKSGRICLSSSAVISFADDKPRSRAVRLIS